MGGGAYLTNRNINNNLALKKQQEQEVDPIATAIRNVSTPVPPVTPMAVTPKVDSLDQAITPIASNRTTTQLFPDYAPATPEVAIAAPVTPTYNFQDILKQARGLMDVDLANDLNGDGRVTSADALAAAKIQNITTPTAQQETTAPVVGPTPWVSGGAPNLNAEGIDLNKQLATNTYGGALKYSQLSPADQAVVDARRTAEKASSPTGATPYQGVERQDFGVGTQYETPEEALSALPDYLGSLSQQSETVDEQYNLANYDPSEFVRAGFTSTPGSVSKAASVDSAVDYLNKNKVPMSKEIDGETRYLTTGLGSDVLFETIGEEGGLKTEGGYKELGPVGTYSTVYVPPVSPLNDPILQVVGAFLPPVALATTAMKAVAGETLKSGDWLNLASAGLNKAGLTTPPATDATGNVLDEGVGLLGTSYDQTQNIMEAAAAAGSDGNPAEILIKGFGVTDDVLDSIGLDEAAFDDSIVDYKGFVEGVEQAASQVAGGDSIEDAIKGGVLDYIVESEGDIDLGVVTDAVEAVGSYIDDNIFQPIIDTVGDIDLGEFEDTVRDLGREFDDEVLQEIKGGIEEFAPQVEDFVKTVGGAAVEAVETVGGEVIDALEPIGTAITDIAKVTGSTVEDVLKGVGDLTEDLGTGLVDAIETGGKALEDFIKPIGETVADIAKATGSTVEDVLKGVASVGEDIIGEVGDVGQDVIDALKPLGSTLEDFAKATGSTLEDVLKDVGGLGEDILGGVADVGSDVIDAVKASGLSTKGMLQTGFEGLAAQQAAQAADARRLAVATRTTDSLFSDFKGFETEIGGTPIELVELIQRNRR